MELATNRFLAKQREELVKDRKAYLVLKRMIDLIGA